MILTIDSKKYGPVNVIIDDGLDWIFKYTWYVNFDDSFNKYYVRSWKPREKGQPRKALRLHRLLLEEKLGRELLPTEYVDHINGDTLDNRLENLRLASSRQNAQNKKVHRSGHLLGTSFRSHVNKWVARIRINGKKVHLGYFETEQEAHEAYLKALAEQNLQLPEK